MSDYIKELTIIDFLGILVPGSILILAFSLDWGSGGAIWTGYFGSDCGDGVKVTILLVAGYLLGMLLHEVGDLLDKAIWHIYCLDPKSYAAKAVGADRILEHYEGQCADPPQNLVEPRDFLEDIKHFFCLPKDGEELENKDQTPEAAKEKREAIDRVRALNPMIQTVLGNSGRGAGKRRLFEGFHVVMRNLLLVLLVLFIHMGHAPALRKICYARLTQGQFWGLCFILALIMLIRSFHYAYLKYKYAYEDFLFTDPSAPQTKPAQSQPAQSQSAQSQPAQSQPAQSQPAQSQSEQSQPADPAADPEPAS